MEIVEDTIGEGWKIDREKSGQIASWWPANLLATVSEPAAVVAGNFKILTRTRKSFCTVSK